VASHIVWIRTNKNNAFMKWLKCVLAATITFLIGIGIARILTERVTTSSTLSGYSCFARQIDNRDEITSSNSVQPVAEITDIFLADKELSYNGYRVEILYKDVTIDKRREEVSYCVLRRNGLTLLKFDGVYSGIGNGTRFGLLSLLGNEEKQLVVSQDIYRGGNQWIVTLGKSPRKIYDGAVWETGREGDDLGIMDIDADGTYEIFVPITSFYNFADHRLSMMNVPLPSVVFKFDRRAQRYVPANPLFAEYLLSNHKDREISPPSNADNHLGDVMKATLDYLLARREAEAWLFFERECKLPDKAQIKRKIKSVLAAHPVYRHLKPGVTGFQ